MKRLWAAAAAVIIALALCGCTEEARAAKEEEARKAAIEETTVVVTEDTIGELEEYPNLKKVDVSGSTCYDAIERYMDAHPEVEVLYTVDVCGQKLRPEETEITLKDGDYTPEALSANLKYLHSLKSIFLSETSLDQAGLDSLQQALPGVEITWNMRIAGILCDENTEFLDLSAVGPEQVEAVAQELSRLPGLKEAELMAEDGTARLSVEEVGILQKAAPNVLFRYSFTLFDKPVSTTDEEIKYANKYIGNREGAEETLRQALDILKGCKRFVLDNCHFKNEVMAQIREDYRDQTKVVWRIWFGKEGGCLTDREVIRHVYGLTSSNSTNLKYCEDARFIDVGHNEMLFDVDFVRYMPNLEAIIVSGAPIKDLTAFENSKNLKFLEIAYCGYIEDLSPLAGCTSLERLNAAFTAVTDLTVLDDRQMAVMVDTHSAVPDEERIRFDELHPDCLVQHSGDQPYGYPWRYNPDKSPNEYYGMLREVFDYAHATNTRF